MPGLGRAGAAGPADGPALNVEPTGIDAVGTGRRVEADALGNLTPPRAVPRSPPVALGIEADPVRPQVYGLLSLSLAEAWAPPAPMRHGRRTPRSGSNSPARSSARMAIWSRTRRCFGVDCQDVAHRSWRASKHGSRPGLHDPRSRARRHAPTRHHGDWVRLRGGAAAPSKTSLGPRAACAAWRRDRCRPTRPRCSTTCHSRGGSTRGAETRRSFDGVPDPAGGMDIDIADLGAQVAAGGTGAAESVLVRACMAHACADAAGVVRGLIGRSGDARFRDEPDPGVAIELAVSSDGVAGAAVIDLPAPRRGAPAVATRLRPSRGLAAPPCSAASWAPAFRWTRAASAP